MRQTKWTTKALGISLMLMTGCTAIRRHSDFKSHLYDIDAFTAWEASSDLKPDPKVRWAQFFDGIQGDALLNPADKKYLFWYAEDRRNKRGLHPWLKDLIKVPEGWLRP